MSDDSDESGDEFSQLPNFKYRSFNQSVSKVPVEYDSKFPPPPILSKSLGNSCCCSSQSESSAHGSAASLECAMRKKKRIKDNKSKKLPPLGIYWDIENVSVPKSKSAIDVVRRLREVFLKNYTESEFIVVCDVKKEDNQVLQDLHDSQVSVIHVASTAKNAADDKLRTFLRRFAELHPPPSGVVLISGDANYAADLSDLRFRKKIRVILVYVVNSIAEALLLCANEHHSIAELTEDLPETTKKKILKYFEVYEIEVRNLPKGIEKRRIKCRMERLSANCGGKCNDIDNRAGTAILKFASHDDAVRAQRRIQGEDVFGNKIQVMRPVMRPGRKMKTQDDEGTNRSMVFPMMATKPKRTDENAFGHWGRYTPLYLQDPAAYQQPISRGPSPGFGPSGSAQAPLVGATESMYDQPPPHFFKKPMNPVNRLLPDDQTGYYQQGASPFSRMQRQISSSSDFSDFDEKPLPLCYNEVAKKNSHHPVELNITNLDPSIDTKELRRLLTNLVKEYANIVSLSVSVQSDGSPVATLKVSNQQEAQFIISQLHRQKLGNKRIAISYVQNTQNDPEQLKAMVVSILQEVPDRSMPLFKFMELLESRFQYRGSVSDVKMLRDVVKITENLGSRIISLMRNSGTPNLTKAMVPFCSIHCPMGRQNLGWCELEPVQAPNLMIPLSTFASKLMSLLNFHCGSMPLLSFQMCYEQVFQTSLPVDENGVPLEHLITCVPNIEIRLMGINKNVKVIQHETSSRPSDEDSVLKSVAPSLAPSFMLLCRELVDLLKTTDKCQLLLTKFIPAYHHHFGRQCRVADYGYTKLVDLFESIPHVIQIMGDGTRRVITLTHTAQIRRFTSDLLRILKVQPSRQITGSEFPSAYEKCMNRPFSAVEYGLCCLKDLLQEVPESTVVITEIEKDLMIATPRREQTPEEIKRTKLFSNEVVDLLKHVPYYTMLFSKFVPAYHHHFGHQCKVSDYGFSKLIELFEAIPDIVKIEDLPQGDRTVSLTDELSLKILGSQLTDVVKAAQSYGCGPQISCEDISSLYFMEYGYPLRPDVFQCATTEELMEKLCDFVQVTQINSQTFVSLNRNFFNVLRVRCWITLVEPPHCMDFKTFSTSFTQYFKNQVSLDTLKKVCDVVSISSMDKEPYVSLTSVYVLAAQLYHVICANGGSVMFNNLERCYQDVYKMPLQLSNFNIRSINEFYNQFNLLFYVKGSKKCSVIVLNKNLVDHLNALASQSKSEEAILEQEGAEEPRTPQKKHRGTCLIAADAVKSSPMPAPYSPPAPMPYFSINLPINLNPILMGDVNGLVSPAKGLFSSPWNPPAPPPKPAEVPMPNKFLEHEPVRERLTLDPSSGGNGADPPGRRNLMLGGLQLMPLSPDGQPKKNSAFDSSGDSGVNESMMFDFA